MTDSDALIKSAEKGFGTLSVSKQAIESAIHWLKTWLTDKAFEDYVPQIRHLIEAGKWEFLLDSFYQVIPFGTGGRRGLVGIGPNRINPWTIQSSSIPRYPAPTLSLLLSSA